MYYNKEFTDIYLSCLITVACTNTKHTKSLITLHWKSAHNRKYGASLATHEMADSAVSNCNMGLSWG